MPNMDGFYKKATGRTCQQKDFVTIDHHYRFDIFNSAIDFQVEELNTRFNDETVELLRLSSALEPKDNFKLFIADSIYTLVEKFYPADFSAQEIHQLSRELGHYKFDILHHQSFQDLSTITKSCQRLFETNKAQYYI